VSNWNNSGTNPGPWVNASDGDTVTLILRTGDGAAHNWYLDFNNDYVLDSNEKLTESRDFNTTTNSYPGGGLNFTFSANHATLPHGGFFTYRCLYHNSMHGNFKFNAGPVASFTHSPLTPLAGHPVSFDGSISWPTTGYTITKFNWNFGDGNTTSSGSSSSITHVYSTNKTYTVVLNTTDSDSQSARANGTVKVLPLPLVRFDYQIATSPANATIFAGQSTTVVVGLSLVSGTDNVALSVLLSPPDPIVQVSPPNVTSGSPPFSARFSITTTSSNLCPPDPCFLSKTYTITIVAVSNTGVDHNATFTLILKPTPSPSPPLNYPLFAAIGAVAGLAVLTVFFVLRRGKRRRMESRPAQA